MGDISLESWEKRSKENAKKYAGFLKRVNKNKVLKQLPDAHKEAFSKIDCLDCSACCKNYSPRFKMPDIKRISKYLRMKETEFVTTYLTLDIEGDYVLQSRPCNFLGEDNMCSIYDFRPSDCQRFPYTNEDVLFKKPLITMKNSEFCPAVFYVLEKLTAEK